MSLSVNPSAPPPYLGYVSKQPASSADDLRLQFEAVSGFDEEEKRVVPSLLEGMILKHEARRGQNVPATMNGGAGRK